MKRVLLLVSLLLPFFLGATNSENYAGIRTDTVVVKTYEFVSRNGKPLLMDVYSPSNPRPDSACVVYMFGGGFVMGSRKVDSLFMYRMAEKGYTAVSIDYRLHLKEVDFDTIPITKTQGVFRDAINIAASDCAAAIGFLYEKSEELDISKSKIVLCGCSAGAIAVLQLDYCRANGLPPAKELPVDFVPACVVAFSGAVYADGGTPKYRRPPAPTFFLHGDKDKIVNYKKFPPLLRSGLYGPKKLHKVFENNDYPHWFFVFEGIGHEVAGLCRYMSDEMDAFVSKTLNGKQMFYDATVRDSNVRPTKWSTMSVFDLYLGK